MSKQSSFKTEEFFCTVNDIKYIKCIISLFLTHGPTHAKFRRNQMVNTLEIFPSKCSICVGGWGGEGGGGELTE
jgi:hypothetical protein